MATHKNMLRDRKNNDKALLFFRGRPDRQTHAQAAQAAHARTLGRFHYSLMVMVFTAVLNLYGITNYLMFSLLSLTHPVKPG